jgi:hypothetical protein
LLRVRFSDAGLTLTLGWAGVANDTLTLDWTVLPAASVQVTCHVSLKLSLHDRVAEMAGALAVLLDTELRLPVRRTQA